MRVRFVILLLVLSCLVQGCARRDALDDILERGKLTVVSRNSPTTFYLDRDKPTGFEYALAGLLAKDLGVELEMQTAFSLAEIFERLQRGEADFAAAGLTLTGQREASFPHTASYYKLHPQVVYKAGNFRPRRLEQVEDMEIAVLEGSSHVESLAALWESGFDSLHWREIPGADSMDLLEEVESGRVPLAIIDSNEFRVQQSLYPRLKVAFDLGSEQDMVWYLSPQPENTRLLERIDRFLAHRQEDGTLDRLREEHFGHTDGVSRIGSHTFNRNMRRKLPRHQSLIRQVALEYQMDWRLLAAIAYQESHWNPSATSPTGVRGMMMLTLPTAREMGVANRLDSRESLRGGARYFKNMKRRLPKDIYDPDRTWLALAAYNIGMGHLEDARVLTERHGGDPHVWRDVMDHLPLLQKPDHYQNTRYGFARGQEAVTYVQNIRHYYSILEWQDIPDSKPQPPLVMDEHLPPAIRQASLQAL
jgi:membrane-bound lytic murein transglycosylase F